MPRIARTLTRLLVAAAVAGAALLAAPLPAPAHASVDDFSYESWDAKYVLDLDAEGRAVARVTETLVPVFPGFDQNRGLVRALPLDYEDSPVPPTGISVTDGSGSPVPFTTEDDGRFRSILVGDDSYVRGRQTYVISYSLRDVVVAASKTKVDEFYWDVLPIERKQRVDSFSLDVEFAPALAKRLTGNAACYTGPSDSKDRCGIEAASPSETTANASVRLSEVAPGSGVTVAIGLEPGTVVQPPNRVPNFWLDWFPAILALGALGCGIASAILVGGLVRRRRFFRGTIVAQYDVPPHLPPLLAANLVGGAKSVLPAEFVHLAVRGATRIEDSPEPESFWSGKKPPAFRLIDPAAASDPLDQRTLAELFSGLAPGQVFQLPKQDSRFAQRMQKLAGGVPAEAKARGYTTTEASRSARILALVGLGLVLVTAPFFVLGIGRPQSLTFGVGALLLASFVLAIIGLAKHRVLTPAGAEAREYLLGVRLFTSVAEADRIRTLQSYTGAERLEESGVNVVQLYERLLPYAMLFGLEKEWGRTLEVRYQEAGVAVPIWYPGLAAHGLTGLDRSLSDMSSSFSSSASYSSSSSGGSSGGGFSGGGGGGGFSGGR